MHDVNYKRDDIEMGRVERIYPEYIPAQNTVSRVPKTHLCWSVLSTLCCICSIPSLFCSIQALVFSYKTVDDIENNDFSKANRHSKISRKLNCYATVCWSIGLLIFIATTIAALVIFLKFLKTFNSIDDFYG